MNTRFWLVGVASLVYISVSFTPFSAYSENRIEILKSALSDIFDQDSIDNLFENEGVLRPGFPVSCLDILDNLREDPSYRLTGKESLRRGVEYYNEYKNYFDRAESEYGVPPEVILGIFRMETWFGKCVGAHNAFPALLNTYLTRAKPWNWILEEMINLIRYCQSKGCDPNTLPSSSRGAIGISQFLPSNYWRFAVDGNYDDDIDLYSHPDAIMSTANFLVERGHWSKGASRSEQEQSIYHYNPTYDHYVYPVFRYADAIRELLNEL